MKKQAYSILILFSLLLSIAPLTMAQERVALVANSIDMEMNPNLLPLIESNGFAVDYFGQMDSGYEDYSYIILLGGPDAIEHTGSISGKILLEPDQSKLRNGNYNTMYKSNDFYKSGQTVFVLAGSDREYTKAAVNMYISGIIFNINNGSKAFATYKTINAAQLKDMVENNEDMYLIDLRSEWVYRQGHIEGSVNIPFDARLPGRVDEIPRDKRVVFYCTTGKRSEQSAQMLIEKGFSDVYATVEGYSVYASLN